MNINPHHEFGPGYDAYQMRVVAEQLAETNLTDSAMVEIIKTRAVLDRLIEKTRKAA